MEREELLMIAQRYARQNNKDTVRRAGERDGYAYFHVMTDRGECRFTINMGSNAVVRLSDSRLLITDLDENRFEIRDVFALTQKEQRKLDLFL